MERQWRGGVPGAPRRVLIVRALFLGDLIVATPALRALRRAWPLTEITLLGRPWAAEFAVRCPYLDRFQPFPGNPDDLADAAWDAVQAWARAERFDLVLHWHGRLPPARVRLLGGRWTVGLCAGADCADLDLPVPYGAQHETLRLLSTVRALGLPADGVQPEFWLRPADLWLAEALLPPAARGRPLVVLHPGARHPERAWPPERFAAVADWWARQGAVVALVGGPADRSLSERVRARARAPLIDLVGRTSLGLLGALVARAVLFIGNDSGPAHLATALRTPSVVIFRRCMVAEWAPLDRRRHRPLWGAGPCAACDRWAPGDHTCLLALSVEEVCRAAGSLVSF
jgi:ADP-heptose:LPS heptosyltransferase